MCIVHVVSRLCCTYSVLAQLGSFERMTCISRPFADTFLYLDEHVTVFAYSNTVPTDVTVNAPERVVTCSVCLLFTKEGGGGEAR
jgi:hypothetical protein